MSTDKRGSGGISQELISERGVLLKPAADPFVLVIAQVGILGGLPKLVSYTEDSITTSNVSSRF
jgi:hypothetical protein